MDTLAVKVPEGQKRKLGEIAEEEGYPNTSEFVREMIREEINKRKVLRQEFVEEIEERVEQVENGEISLEDMKTNEELKS
ncbi:ribbon-helix-helix domain-containing protein [Candidatus Nanohalobium constans]|uniref:CopG family transcriptional regulator n=1 Tax=Candidatus Nanohalobium constans TaxID=2565781 RepID=A0A5Q0UEV1_9ARCH|nr:ribbon-helix-helix domain-containing protein [Candidatus Nanohalobium constans]QGA80077.1 CopG family transcriptional regulator [Candidatus Nanohalobium constans]